MKAIQRVKAQAGRDSASPGEASEAGPPDRRHWAVATRAAASARRKKPGCGDLGQVCEIEALPLPDGGE